MNPWNTQQYRAIEKFWHEPDFEFGCAYALPYAILRDRQKAFCGYVGIPAGHPHFGKSYGDPVEYPKWRSLTLGKKSPLSLFCVPLYEGSTEIAVDLLYNVHGGITYAADHYPEGQKDGRWWIGFDCLHAGDLSPQAAFHSFSGYPWTLHEGEKYRDLAYVRAECFNLARQLSDFTSNYPEEL